MVVTSKEIEEQETRISYGSASALKSDMGFHTFQRVIRLDNAINQRIVRIGELAASVLRKTSALISSAFAANNPDTAWLRDIMLGSIPLEHRDYARELMMAVGDRCPARFFRADVVGNGKIAELQCPGSGWAYQIALEKHYGIDLSNSDVIRAYKDRANGRVSCWWLYNDKFFRSANFLAQTCRQAGVRMDVVEDKNFNPDKTELVIKRPWLPELIVHPKGRRLLERWLKGEVEIDPMPSMAAETKHVMALLYHPATRDAFTEEERILSPPTYFIQSKIQKVEMLAETREKRDCANRRRRSLTIQDVIDRGYYVILKYSGAAEVLRASCHAVYNIGVKSMDLKERENLFALAIADYQRHEPWIIQEYTPEPWNSTLSEQTGKTLRGYYTIFRPHYYVDGNGMTRLAGNTITARSTWKVHAQSDAYLGLCK